MAAFSLPRWLIPRQGPGPNAPWCRTALSREASLDGSLQEISQQLRGVGPADLALVFVSASYASDLPRLLPLLQQRIRASHWLGCLGGGVVGTPADGLSCELEQEPGISVMLLRLPGASLQPFAIEGDALPDLDGPAEPWLALLGDPDPRTAHSMLLLIDPAFPAINDLISGLDYACPAAVKVGGIAGQHSARHGSLLLGDRVVSGVVGCLIGGAWGLDPVVAQGCRPIGPIFEVEQAERNVVLEVSQNSRRNSPVAALQDILIGLSAQERDLVKHSLFLGVGRNSFSLESGENKEPTAFLVRNLIGVDPRNGAVAVAERMRVGQQVQFQLRDATASRQELRQLLALQQGRQAQPLATLLFACLGRGQGLYGEADGDVTLCREAFGSLPVAGAFCNGEIGPIAGSTQLHGYTASWGFVVPRPDVQVPPAAGQERG